MKESRTESTSPRSRPGDFVSEGGGGSSGRGGATPPRFVAFDVMVGPMRLHMPVEDALGEIDVLAEAACEDLHVSKPLTTCGNEWGSWSGSRSGSTRGRDRPDPHLLWTCPFFL